jgi:iron complex outermembrane receptor protein
VRVYLDGVPLNSALGGGVNLGNIPLSNVERIEVYKGTIPAKFGGSGLGGVVHIVTKSMKARVGGYGLKSGTFGTRQTSAFFSGKHSDFNYLTAIDYTESDNDFPFLDDNGTRYNKADDEWRHRQNNGFQSANLIGKILWKLSGGAELSVNNNFCWSSKGIPGRGSFQSRFARLKVIRNLTELSFLRRRFLRYGWTLGLKGFNTYYASDYRDLEAEVGIGKQDNHNVTRTYGGEISLKSIVGQYQVWSLLLKWKQERFLPSDRLHHEHLFESKRWSYSLAAEDEIVLLREKLSCVFSLRQESYQNRFYGDYTHGHWVKAPARKRKYRFLSHRLGVKYKTFSWLTIKGNIGKYYRVPSFYELFGDKGATIGNTDLEPERGLSHDIGFRVSIGNIGRVQKSFLEIAYFDNRLDNLIQFIQHSQMTSRPENIGKAHIQGLEVTGKTAFFGHLRIEGNFTYQQALNRSDLYGGIYYGKLLPNKAKWETNIRATTFSGDYGEVFYGYSYTDKNFHDLYNKVQIERRVIHSIGFTVVCPWQHQLKGTFEAKNLTDTQVADLWGYPLPGRSYYVTINGTF